VATIPSAPKDAKLPAMYPGSRSLKPQGFTLVELLVGLTLMALVSIILFGGMRFGMRAWETGGERIERTTRIELVQTLLRRQLGQARLPSNSAGKPPVAFSGQRDRVTFVAPSAKHGEASDAFVFVLRWSDTGQRSHLNLAWTPLQPPASAETVRGAESAARLIEDVATVELAYYGALDPKRPAQWWDEWDGANGLPALMRLRLTFPEGDSRRWPDLIVRVVRAPG
jgi:general secretion pathway protein J